MNIENKKVEYITIDFNFHASSDGDNGDNGDNGASLQKWANQTKQRGEEQRFYGGYEVGESACSVSTASTSAGSSASGGFTSSVSSASASAVSSASEILEDPDTISVANDLNSLPDEPSQSKMPDVTKISPELHSRNRIPLPRRNPPLGREPWIRCDRYFVISLVGLALYMLLLSVPLFYLK